MLEFEKYAKIKDHYCICYFGPSDEYLLQLKLLKPIIESQFLGIKVFFGCRDEKIHLFDDQNVMKVSEIKVKRYDFAHINELRFDGLQHPVEQFIKNSGITDCCIVTNEPIKTKKCVIITTGQHPTKNLQQKEVDALKKLATEDGYDVEIDTNVESAGLVMGVESYLLFEAASKGIKTKLVPRGMGTNLYKRMFSDAEVLNM